MQYLAVPFNPPASRDSTATAAAADLNALIARHASDGWEFLGMDNHSTVVPGSAGCFGIGATHPYPVTVSIVVFKK